MLLSSSVKTGKKNNTHSTHDRLKPGATGRQQETEEAVWDLES